MLSFKVGRKTIDPPVRKERTAELPIEEAAESELYYFPLSMHIGKPADLVVEVGDQVKVGTLLGKKSGPISANIHSSVSGEVIAIREHTTVNGRKKTVVVQNDHNYTEDYATPINWRLSDAQTIIDRVRDAGIVGMGGATFPTDIKLSPKNASTIDTIIVNGAECESYSTSDYRVMMAYSAQLVEGLLVLEKLYPGLKHSYIAIERNEHECVRNMSHAIKNHQEISIEELPTLYPQGAEKTLIKTVLGREVSPGQLPADVHTVVINVSTLYAIYEAIVLGKPSVERITTVTGGGIKTAKNLRVRIGTPLRTLLEQCGGLKDDTYKMIHGGTMMGRLFNHPDNPILKGTSCVIALTPEESRFDPEEPCIRCSECLNVCPVSLQPILISEAYRNGDIERAKELGALDCIECGNCSYICPAHIDLLGDIRKAKSAIRALEGAK